MTAQTTACCYVGWTGIPTQGREATIESHGNQAAHRTGCTEQMSGVRRHSAKRDGDRVRPMKSWRQISPPLIGKLGQLELGILLPLVFTANVIVATIAWSVVGSLLR
jgi:hypothetical protein